jgi:hypothetical protein
MEILNFFNNITMRPKWRKKRMRWLRRKQSNLKRDRNKTNFIIKNKIKK